MPKGVSAEMNAVRAAAGLIVRTGHPTASDRGYAYNRVLADHDIAKRIHAQAVARLDEALAVLRRRAERTEGPS